MYERAGRLAGLSGADNPLFASVDSWSFSVPLERARVYYRERLLSERPASDSAEEQARSALRKRFYAYAISELREAFVHETADSFSASFPRFPRNTEQMRATRLYTEPVYPVTVDGELPVMHAWDGCPEAGLVDYYGSAEEWESGSFETCPACKFTASALGSVASASTSIDNGFEYHYDAVAQAAADYQKARADAEPLSRAAKGKAEGPFGRGSGRARRCGRLPHQSGSSRSGGVHRLRRLDGNVGADRLRERFCALKHAGRSGRGVGGDAHPGREHGGVGDRRLA